MNIVKFLILAACGLAIRLWLVPNWALVPSTENFSKTYDSAQYEQFASNLLHHGTFSDDTATPPAPNAHRTPIYPLFLTAIYAVAGANTWRAVQIVQALIDFLTCWLVYRIARELFRDRLVGFWSFGTSLIAPPMLIFTGYVMTETLATFWTASALFCMLKACRTSHSRWFVGLGIFSAAAGLTRPGLMLLPLFWLPAFFMTPEGRRFLTPMRGLLALFCGLFLFLPWVTRNAITLHECEFLSSSRGTAADAHARGYHRWLSTWVDSQAYTRTVISPVVYAGSGYKPDDVPSIDRFPTHAFDSKTEQERVADLLRQVRLKMAVTPEVDAEFSKLAKEKIHTHPVRYYVLLPLYRMLMLWSEPLGHWFLNPGVSVKTVRLAQLINIAIVTFGFAGLWVLRRQWRDTAPLWLAMWACTIGAALTCFTVANVNPRLVVPAYPVMCIFASACAFHLTRGKSPLKTSTEIYEADFNRW